MHEVVLAILIVLVAVLVALLVVAIVLGVRLWRLWSVVQDPDMPAASKVAFYGALAYSIFPVDVLPDPIYLDDVGVLLGAIAFITQQARSRGLIGGSGRSVDAARPTHPGEPARRPGAEPGPDYRDDYRNRG